MSKELEAFSKEKQALDELYDVAGNIKNLKNDYIILKTALQRLEAIDNSKPSEALGKLRELRAKPLNWDTLIKVLDEVEQALLKAEEMEKELEKFCEYEVYEKIDGETKVLAYCKEARIAELICQFFAFRDPKGDPYYYTPVPKLNTFIPGGGWYIGYHKNKEGKLVKEELS
ncbi:MAG: hypothetical protein K6E20_03755 [Acholeplasmatales bacterium]|nr:hypothetical protein [Acholeplasmatales bacterium]